MVTNPRNPTPTASRPVPINDAYPFRKSSDGIGAWAHAKRPRYAAKVPVASIVYAKKNPMKGQYSPASGRIEYKMRKIASNEMLGIE